MTVRDSICKGFLALILASGLVAAGLAQEDAGGLAKVKERELETVREKISTLKKSMDKRAADRDRLTSDLQQAEVQISEKRIRLKEIEKLRQFSEKRKAELEQKLSKREAELEQESVQLAALNDYRGNNIGKVKRYIDELAELHQKAAARGQDTRSLWS
jgi:chromosome segregation ATPase